MRILVDNAQMKQCDRNTIEYFGIPSLALMERAALGVAEEIERRLAAYREGPGTGGRGLARAHTALVACGLGNNGGDGLAAARMLWQKGYAVTVVMPPEMKRMSEETKIQLGILEKYRIPICSQMPEGEFDVVVDALFGIGLTRELAGAYREYVKEMNKKQGLKVAVDIPSGIHGDTGAVMGIGFQADVTVTFAFAKPGLMLFPGAGYAGEVKVWEIGIDRNSFLAQEPDLFCLEPEDMAEIPARRTRTNKGSYGKVLAIAGQKNMAGAAFLSAKASYLTGAGLVKVMTPEENRVILQQLLPEAVLETYADMPGNLHDCLEWASVVVAGPGLGTGEKAEALVQEVLACAEVPLILDADGLNIVAKHPDWLKKATGTVIVTPHLGEMARLTGKSIPSIQENILYTARQFAKEYRAICVLKDARTVTALPDGRAWVNASGNNGMATAGSGDVLTGILAGLAAQGMEPQRAAPMGVYLHGLAGDVQAADRGRYGLMAQDILEGIARVLAEGPDAGRMRPIG